MFLIFFFLIGVASGTKITRFPFKLGNCTCFCTVYRSWEDCPLAWLDSLVRTLYERLALHCSCVTTHLAIWLAVTLESEPMAWLYKLHFRLASVSAEVCHWRRDVAQIQVCIDLRIMGNETHIHNSLLLVFLFTDW